MNGRSFASYSSLWSRTPQSSQKLVNGKRLKPEEEKPANGKRLKPKLPAQADSPQSPKTVMKIPQQTPR